MFFPPLSPFLMKVILKAHISNLSCPSSKLELEFSYNEILMITWKMTCMIQSILPSHCLCNVNLGNYIRLPYVLKLLHLSVLSPWTIKILTLCMMNSA